MPDAKKCAKAIAVPETSCIFAPAFAENPSIRVLHKLVRVFSVTRKRTCNVVFRRAEAIVRLIAQGAIRKHNLPNARKDGGVVDRGGLENR